MKETEQQKYIDVMNEIMKRVNLIYSLLSKEYNTLDNSSKIELTCLQVRKILELIALGSLVANQKLFLKKIHDLQKMRNPKYILKDIERLNPDFYPIPIYEEPSDEQGVQTNLIDIKDGYLTQKDFIKIYNKCGNILHANNPFKQGIDYKYYEHHIPIWMEKIRMLLKVHRIKLLNNKSFYLVHMQEKNNIGAKIITFIEN